MTSKEFYKGHALLVIGFMNDWTVFVNYAPFMWVESKDAFNSPPDAIAYGKAQIDILLSKSLNLKP